MIFNQVSSWLWQGNSPAAIIPPAVALILNTAPPDLRYMTARIYLGMPVLPNGEGLNGKKLTTMLRFCQEHKPYGIHVICNDGISVSPAICVLALQVLDGMELPKAVELVKRLNPFARMTDDLRSVIKEAAGLEIHLA